MHSIEIQEWLDQNREQPRTGGITAVDLLDLPVVLNQVMRVLFAKAPITESQLRTAVADAPEALPLEDEDLHSALIALCDQRWLISTPVESDAGEAQYRINFRAKDRSTPAPRSWQVLDFES